MSEQTGPPPDSTYPPYSVTTWPADVEWDGPFCRETGELAVNIGDPGPGNCPVHGPDDNSCLWYVPAGTDQVVPEAMARESAPEV